MRVRRFTHTTTADEAGVRLDAAAAAWLRAVLGRPLSKSTVRRLIMSGVVRVNGRPTRRAGQVLDAGTRLEASVDERRLPPAQAEAPATIEVLYEDEALIAVAKPPGLAIHASADPSRPDLFTLVRRRLAGDGASSTGDSLPYLGLHQRLDRDTSGAVLFTKVVAANPGLARQFEEHRVEKVYHALTVRPTGSMPASWEVSNSLAQVGKGGQSRMRSAGSGGTPAKTVFRVLERLPSALLVEARPLTGRKHQIRAHLSERTPILGDVRYGGPARLGDIVVPRAMLHARALGLQHPVSGVALRIECEYAEDFRDVLEALRGPGRR